MDPVILVCDLVDSKESSNSRIYRGRGLGFNTSHKNSTRSIQGVLSVECHVFYITAKIIYLLQVSLDGGNVLHLKIIIEKRHHLTMSQKLDRMSIQSISGTCYNNVTQASNV